MSINLSFELFFEKQIGKAQTPPIAKRYIPLEASRLALSIGALANKIAPPLMKHPSNDCAPSLALGMNVSKTYFPAALLRRVVGLASTIHQWKHER